MKTIKDNKNNEAKKNQPRRKQAWLIIAFIIAVFMVVGLVQAVNTPRNLSEKLVFLKKVNTGCEWWEVPLYLGLCNGPSYEYYFATDIDKDELKEYFQKASLVDTRSRYSTSPPFTLENTRFIFEYEGKDFVVDMPASKEQVTKERNLRETDLPYIIKIPDFDYDIAKSAI